MLEKSQASAKLSQTSCSIENEAGTRKISCLDNLISIFFFVTKPLFMIYCIYYVVLRPKVTFVTWLAILGLTYFPVSSLAGGCSRKVSQVFPVFLLLHSIPHSLLILVNCWTQSILAGGNNALHRVFSSYRWARSPRFM